MRYFHHICTFLASKVMWKSSNGVFEKSFNAMECIVFNHLVGHKFLNSYGRNLLEMMAGGYYNIGI